MATVHCGTLFMGTVRAMVKQHLPLCINYVRDNFKVSVDNPSTLAGVI